MNVNEFMLSDKELKNMTPEELAEYKVELDKLALDVEDLIKKCDDILSK